MWEKVQTTNYVDKLAKQITRARLRMWHVDLWNLHVAVYSYGESNSLISRQKGIQYNRKIFQLLISAGIKTLHESFVWTLIGKVRLWEEAFTKKWIKDLRKIVRMYFYSPREFFSTRTRIGNPVWILKRDEFLISIILFIVGVGCWF